ncbi:hypothetical protein GCM10020256_39400 [Streptomyces thermocoprophilus]
MREGGVDAVGVGADPVGGLGVVGAEGVPAAAGGVGEAGAAGEAVPGQVVGAEEGGRRALQTVPFDFELPGPVAGGDQALGVGEGKGVVRAQVGDAPGVAVDLDGHPVLPLCAVIVL